MPSPIASGDAVVVVDEWCQGYLRGVDLATDEWQAAPPEVAELLAPIRAFTDTTNWLAHELPESEAVKIRQVPGSLPEALDALQADHAFLLEGEVFTKDLIETWVELKRKKEVDFVRMRPHPAEFFLYFDA